jgi:hypothetical protein
MAQRQSRNTLCQRAWIATIKEPTHVAALDLKACLECAHLLSAAQLIADVHSQSARIAAGEIREDISPEDLIRALVGMCYMHDQSGWQKERLIDVFIDGLRCHLQTDVDLRRLRPLRLPE